MKCDIFIQTLFICCLGRRGEEMQFLDLVLVLLLFFGGFIFLRSKSVTKLQIKASIYTVVVPIRSQ